MLGVILRRNAYKVEQYYYIVAFQDKGMMKMSKTKRVDWSGNLFLAALVTLGSLTVILSLVVFYWWLTVAQPYEIVIAGTVIIIFLVTFAYGVNEDLKRKDEK